MRAVTARARRGVSLAALVAAAALVPPAASTPGPTRQCERIAVSPGFVRDGVVFCVGRDSDLPAGGTTRAFLIHSSADRGRTWRQLPAAGLPAAPMDDVLQLVVSPRFGADRTIVVQTLAHGAFVSSDAGETFLPLYLADKPSFTAFVTSVDELGGAAERLMLIGADSSTAPTKAVLVDVATRVPQVVVGSPVPAAAFAVSPAYVRDHRALAFVNQSDGTRPRVDVYACDRSFACRSKVTSFVDGYVFDRAWYLSAQMLVVSVRHPESARPRLYVSRNGGVSFGVYTAAQRLLDTQSAAGDYPEFEFAPTPGGRSAWFRVYGRPGRRPPASRLYRSLDTGGTWRLVAFARVVEPGPRGSLPDFSVPPQGVRPRVLLQGSDDGYVFLGGLSSRGWDLACSADGGTRWRNPCR